MLAGSARAQTSSPDPQMLGWLQQRFPEGRTARVRTQDGEHLLLSPAFISEGVRAVDSAGVVTLTSWSQIERIDARGGSPVKGAWIGGILGAGTGFALSIMLAQGEGGGGWSTVIGGTAVLALGGAVAGAGVGSLFPGWVKVYPGKLGTGSAWGLQKK